MITSRELEKIFREKDRNGQLYDAIIEGKVVFTGSYRWCFDFVGTYYEGCGWCIDGDRSIANHI